MIKLPSDLSIVEEVATIIERKVASNNLVKAKSGKLIAIVSAEELGLDRCNNKIATVVGGIGQLSNCKIIDSRNTDDAFMFHVKVN